MLYSIINNFLFIQTAYLRPSENIGLTMNSILLTGLFQRLLIALIALGALWGIYFWAVGT